MKKTKIIFYYIFIVFVISDVCAQGETKKVNKPDFQNITITNPFQTKLPKFKKEEKKEPAIDQRTLRKKRQEDQKALFTSKKEREKKRREKTKVDAKPTMPRLEITGLVWNTDRPQAIINGQVVDEGDIVSQVQIVSIEKSRIDVKFLGETSTLSP